MTSDLSTLIATAILSATAGVGAGLWFLLMLASVRRRLWWRSLAHLGLALATGSSTILLVLRGRGGGLVIPRVVSTAILSLLFLLPALLAWRDERKAERVLTTMRGPYV